VRGTHTRAKTLRAVDRNVREAIVRIITTRPGLEQADAAMAALTPALILAADREPAIKSGQLRRSSRSRLRRV